MTQYDQLLSELKVAIAKYLDYQVVQPAIRLITDDFAAQDDVASLLVLHSLLGEIAEAHAGMPVDQYLVSVLGKEPIDDSDLAELLSRLADRGFARTEGASPPTITSAVFGPGRRFAIRLEWFDVSLIWG
ncbi:MAG: hypothetical protein ABSH21_04435 [Verrucomicrobiia bacterium]|jgi:hypothetical protein